MSSRHKISLAYSDLQDMLAESPQKVSQPETEANYRAKGHEVSLELHKSFGTWSNRSVHLRDDLDLTVTEWDLQENLQLTVDTQMQPLFGISFCITGGFLTQVSGTTAELMTHSQEVQVGFFQGEVKTTSEIAAGQKVALIQLGVNPRLLKTLMKEAPDDTRKSFLTQLFPSNQGGFQWETRDITPAMTIALHQILHCPYHGLTKRIYLESKALELIALQLNQLSENRPSLSPASGLKPDDVARVHLARDILIGNLENPPSLVALAKQSGINTLKLKQGFRQVFQTTVFGYLHAHRMEAARQLLELSDLSVTQVAQVVGYAHPGKFAAAFKKKFGITPKALKSR
ncbi:MAG TPA: helix-turn-helix transcriptional regulator [Elainellaceae cyanobacterium]